MNVVVREISTQDPELTHEQIAGLLSLESKIEDVCDSLRETIRQHE